MHHMGLNHVAGQFQTHKSFRNYAAVYINGSFILYVQNESLRPGIDTGLLTIH